MAFKPEPEYATKEAYEQYICEFVASMWRNYEQETGPDRSRMTEALGMMVGKMDWGEYRESQDWMSKPFLYEFSKIIRGVVATMKSLVFEKDDFYQLTGNDPENPGNVELARIFTKLLRYDIRSLNLPRTFEEYCLMGGATGLGVLKVVIQMVASWSGEVVLEQIEKQEAEDRKKLGKDVENRYRIPDDPEGIASLVLAEMNNFFGQPEEEREFSRNIKPKKRLEMKISANVVDPRNFAWEPDAPVVQDSMVKIERIDKKFYECEAEFESGNFDPSKREDLRKTAGKLGNTSASTVSSYELQKLGTRDQFDQRNPYTPNVELLDYYGPLLGKDGRIIATEQHFVVGNSKVLLKAQQNPYYDQLDPFIITIFCKSPGKGIGQGIADSGLTSNKLMNELMATFFDMLNLAVYSPTVIDDTALRDPEDIEDGIYPGMVIKTFGKSANEVMSKPTYDASPAPWVFQVIEKLSLNMSTSAGVQTGSSNPASRARITAQEIQSNQGRNDESALNLAQEIDNGFLRPLFQKLINYRLQFGFEIDALETAKMTGVITEAEFDYVANIPRIERYNEIKRHYRLDIKGFRNRLELQSRLRNIVELLKVLPGFPPEAIGRIDWDNVLGDTVEAFGFEPERWLIGSSPQDAAREENKLLLQGREVGLLPDDDHNLHLPIHTGQFIKQPNPATLEHIAATVEAIMNTTGQIPELPPEVMQALGIAPSPQNTGQLGQQGPRLLEAPAPPQ